MAASEIRNPVFARVYSRASKAMERSGLGEHRRRLLAGLGGVVVEVGAGNGLNFAHYSPQVSRVVAVEPEPYLRAEARAAAERAPVPVEVVDGTAEQLPVPDACADAAVACLVLCSVADVDAALAELRRVLRPGGVLRFFEHVRSEHRWAQQAQRLADLVWPHFGGGCHTSRDTIGALERDGFALTRVERFRFPEGWVPTPTAPHVLGEARLGD